MPHRTHRYNDWYSDYADDSDMWYHANRQASEAKRRRLPRWTPPASDLSLQQLVAHHNECRGFVLSPRVSCPACFKDMKAVAFCGGQHDDDPHFKVGYGSDSECAKLIARSGVHLGTLKRWVRLIVQYCTPHEGMPREVLESFPGWPLKLNAALVDWVQACTEHWSDLPETRVFDYKLHCDSGPDSDAFNYGMGYGELRPNYDAGDKLRHLRSFVTGVASVVASTRAADEETLAAAVRKQTLLRYAEMTGQGDTGVAPLAWMCAVSVADGLTREREEASTRALEASLEGGKGESSDGGDGGDSGDSGGEGEASGSGDVGKREGSASGNESAGEVRHDTFWDAGWHYDRMRKCGYPHAACRLVDEVGQLYDNIHDHRADWGIALPAVPHLVMPASPESEDSDDEFESEHDESWDGGDDDDELHVRKEPGEQEELYSRFCARVLRPPAPHDASLLEF